MAEILAVITFSQHIMKRMYLKTTLTSAGILLCWFAAGQEVISASGGFITGNNTQVNWTIGEMETIAVTGTAASFTSGFNQPRIKLTTSSESIREKVNVSVFPNPASDYIKIRYDGQLPLTIRVFSLTGKEILEHQMADPEFILSLHNLSAGTYLLEVTDKTSGKNLYKIIKQ